MAMILNVLRSATRRLQWTDNSCRFFSTSVGFSSTKWCANNYYGDPVDELQPLLEVPLMNASETAFRPSKQEIAEANTLFKRLEIQNLYRAVDATLLPITECPEVCFIGRSNAGKSSLIKALLNNPTGIKLVVSKTPGRTTVLNFFQLGQLLTLVDMPGYGENMPEHYIQSVEKYVKSRKNLVRAVLLIDGCIGLNEVDKIGIEMMEEFGKPYVVVMTKIDKASRHEVLRNVLNLKSYRNDKMPRALSQIFLVSALEGAGIPLLQSMLLYVTGNLKLEGL